MPSLVIRAMKNDGQLKQKEKAKRNVSQVRMFQIGLMIKTAYG
jgi:hypothetical protein